MRCDMKYKITVRYDVEIPMRDGILLRCNIYGPDDGKAYPAILLRFPYLKDSFESNWGKLNPMPLARAGYHVVVQDCRGTGNSQGEMDFDGECQRNDGYDTVEWIASQKWCDGSVGMYGLSYYGFTQLLAAEAQPPHLRAICPWQQSGFPKYSGGFTTGSLHLMWLLERLRDRLYSRECTWEEKEKQLLIEQTENYLSHFGEVVSYVPQNENPAAKIGNLPLLADYLRRIREYDDPACPAREGRPIDFSKIRIPCFFLGGWYDDTSKNGPIENWNAIAKTEGGKDFLKNCRMIMGPWNHGERMAQSVGVRDFGARASYPMGKSIEEHLIRWFDWHLKGIDDGISSESPVTLFYMGKNEWHSADSWPVEDAGQLTLHLSGGVDGSLKTGRLTSEMGEGSTAYRSDPENPVPARAPGISAECQEQAEIERRNDVAVYTSEILQEEVTVLGAPKAVLYVSSDCPDTDVVCKLTEVYPDGRSVNITDGAVRVSYNNSLTRKLLTPGEVRCVEVKLGNTCNVFGKGSRIRLLLSGSGFPKYDLNQRTKDRIGSSPEMRTSEDIIYHDSGHPSRLELPVQRKGGEG